jgi:uncharacterized protein YkwD
MKYHLLGGTFGVLAIVVGITAVANADVTINIPAGQSDRPDPMRGNDKYTQTPVVNPLELSVHRQINQYRQSRNLPVLDFDPIISAQARIHSEEMAKISDLNHDGFNERLDTVAETITYQSAAENVAFNKGYIQPDATAVKGWLDSPGHHQNILGRYNLTGIGVAQNAKGEYYFTQIFVRKG